MPVPVLVALGALLSAALLIYWGSCIALFRHAFCRRACQGRDRFRPDSPALAPYGEEIAEGIRRVDALPYEKLTITAADGIVLTARLYGGADAPLTLLLFHGYRSFGACDFGGILWKYVEKKGYRVLLPDQRAHGESGGRYITFGIQERRDCAAWAFYLRDRFGPAHPLVLEGMSMGSATVLMAAGVPLPETVTGIVADCGYTSPDAILRKVAGDMHLPASLLLPGVYFLCRHVAHFDPLETTAPAALAESDLPVLLIHGEGDDFVPCWMSEENYRACGSRGILLLIPGATHAMSYFYDRERVEQALYRFLTERMAAFACVQAESGGKR